MLNSMRWWWCLPVAPFPFLFLAGILAATGAAVFAEGITLGQLQQQQQQKDHALSPGVLTNSTDVSTTTAATTTQSAPVPAFTYDRHSFLLHGEPHVLIGGQMDPQRIPRAYWRDRLAKARAMGLNTIFAYVFWNLLEPEPGLWLTGDADADADEIQSNDIAAYFRLAQEEGLHVVLRPGPYVCGERDWGGLPYWLSTIPGLKVRSGSSDDNDNGAFLTAARRYLARLAADLQDLQVTRGGPLLMVQVENEYGSYGADGNYTAALRDILRDLFEVPLYTNDGGVDWTLAGGTVPGVLAAIDGDPASGFAARDRYVTDPSMLGPLLDGEYYTVWADLWGSSEKHNTAAGAGGQETAEKIVADLEFVLRANNSISLYMFHGGTNFGLSSGALWRDGAAAVFTTSYDYGAPLDESGRTTDLYFALRDTIARHAASVTIPEPPANVPLLSIANFSLEPAVSLFDAAVLGKSSYSDEAPATMEALGQAYGFVLYEHVVPTAAAAADDDDDYEEASVYYEGVLQPGDRPRDRVLVYVNGARVGVIDGTYAAATEVSVSLTPGDTLALLVENLGRVDYWSRESGDASYIALEDPYKGIRGNVTVGGRVIEGWDMYSLPVDSPPSLTLPRPSSGGGTDEIEEEEEEVITTSSAPAASSPPFSYRGTFEVPNAAAAITAPKSSTDPDPDPDPDPAALDTFLTIPDGIKGIVWVNGFCLGRYWVVGPQQSLYLPGVFLKGEGSNEVVVLELEPAGPEALTAFGTAERSWGNRPDPDYP
ncbi:hypothetical protein SLS62_007735 [Diatrype stigma]|uniref:Beta-galactosidase n=1 Tax=Diatrype stigma TaxID=117547 RepID=A0AAN9UP80_9PEZI